MTLKAYNTTLSRHRQYIHETLKHCYKLTLVNISNSQYVLKEIHFIILFYILRALISRIFRKKGGPKNRNDNDALGAALLASMFLRGGGGNMGGGGFGGFGGGGFGGGGAGGGW